MKSIEAQNYYEVLEVGRGAQLEEIERAYRMASATWSERSLALYSLFDEQEAAIVRERVTRAYQTLSNEEARREYDLDTFDSPYEQSGELESVQEITSELEAGAFDEIDAALGSTLEDGVEQLDTFDGAQLRRVRLQRGIEIEDIVEATKVSLTYLRCLEEEDWEALPAPVYVRGFVASYARAIGLDPQKVAASYMPRFDEARQGKSRGRLLGRR